MEAMSIMRKTIFSLSKAFPLQSPSLSLHHHRRVSRVCFTSASKHSEGRNAAEGNTSSESDSDAEEKAYEMKEKGKERAHEMKEKAKERAETLKEKTSETAEKAKEGTHEAAETTAGKAKEGTHRAAETAQYAKEKTAEKAKEGTGKAAEVAQNIGEKAKHTVQGAWGAATQKIKETVVGKSDESIDDYIEDHVKKPEDGGGEKTMDEDVVNLRRRAGDEKKQQH